MFAVAKTDQGWVAKETPHYSKLSDDIDIQLSQGAPVVLVMDLAQLEALGIDPAEVTMDGEPIAKKEPTEEVAK